MKSKLLNTVCYCGLFLAIIFVLSGYKKNFFGYPGPKNQKLSAIKLSNGDKIILKKTKTPIGYNLLKQDDLKSITIKK